MDLGYKGCAALAFGVLIDATSVIIQTVAYQKSPSGFASLLSFISVVYALFVDAFIFEESISMIDVLCALIILLVTVVITLDKIRRKDEVRTGSQTLEIKIVKSLYLEGELEP